MGGMGKWVKKNPLQAVGLIGAAIAAPYALPALFGGGAAAAGGAAAGGLLAGDAALSGGSALAAEAGAGAVGALSPMAAEVASVPLTAAVPASGGFMAGLDAMAPYAKFAGQAQGLLSPEQQQPMPTAQPQGYRGPGQQNQMMSPYDDPELKKRMAMMAQSGRFYG
jgi:hypothetical protein